MNSIKRQEDMTLQDELLRSVGVQYATGRSREIVPGRMKRLGQSGKPPAVAVSGCERKLQGCKEQCCTGTRDVRPTNQGRLDVVKQMAEGTLTLYQSVN